jgi:ATP-dependent Clp protease ATP-binding subunit ClpX
MRNRHTSATLARIGRLFRPGLSCSFCGRAADQVQRLVAGASAHICDDCISECVAVLERHPVRAAPEATGAHTPMERS